jgi:hypothetical protein
MSLCCFQTPCAVAPPHVPKVHSKVRTSLDLELDLQASETKLTHLQDEITRLRDLVEMMKDTKTRGRNLNSLSPIAVYNRRYDPCPLVLRYWHS